MLKKPIASPSSSSSVRCLTPFHHQLTYEHLLVPAPVQLLSDDRHQEVCSFFRIILF
jgi:hypothetical protein